MYALIIVRAASRELIPDARIANNRMRRAGCGLSRLVIPRVQQRDCSEEVSERASAATGRARSRIRRVNRVRNNNIYTISVYTLSTSFRVCDSFAALCDKPEITSMFSDYKKVDSNIEKNELE